MGKGKVYTIYIINEDLQKKLDTLGLLGKRSEFVEKALLSSKHFKDEDFNKEILTYKQDTLSKLAELQDNRETKQEHYVSQRIEEEKEKIEETKQETTEKEQKTRSEASAIKKIENLL